MGIRRFNRTRAYFNDFFWLFSTFLLAPYFYSRIFLFKKMGGGELKILVIYTAKIGDLVCATPIFREIKKRFPSSYLTALVTSQNKDILRNSPYINEVVLMTDYVGIGGKLRLLDRLTKQKYDWAFNLLPGLFNNIIAFWSLVPHRVATAYWRAGEMTGLLSFFNNHRLEYKSHTSIGRHYLDLLRFIGIEESSEKREIFIGSDEERRALDFLGRNNLNVNDLLIGVGVAPGDKFKQWALPKYANLADQLVGKFNARIIFTGSADVRDKIANIQKMMQNNSINSAGYFKLHELPAFLKKLKLFISVDAGPVYIADAVGTPVVDIVGTFDVQEQAPAGSKYKILQKDKPPAACSFIDPSSSICLRWYREQLEKITPEEVFSAAVALINN